jgi:hypothetical protein
MISWYPDLKLFDKKESLPARQGANWNEYRSHTRLQVSRKEV